MCVREVWERNKTTLALTRLPTANRTRNSPSVHVVKLRSNETAFGAVALVGRSYSRNIVEFDSIETHR